jgi:hypothetical protein
VALSRDPFRCGNGIPVAPDLGVGEDPDAEIIILPKLWLSVDDDLLVAQGEAVGTTSGATTPAAIELKHFGHFNGAISRNGAPLGNIVSAEITYANNLDRIETIRADGRIDGADPSIAALTGRIEVRFSDAILLNQAIAGDPCELTFGYALPAGESLTFVAHAVYLPRPRIEISGPQGIQASFDWQVARDAGVGRMCTVTLVNGIESY